MDAHTECAKGRPISIGSWRIIFVGSQVTGQVSALIDSNNNHTAGDNLGEIRRAVNGMLRGIRILIECGERVQSQY